MQSDRILYTYWFFIRIAIYTTYFLSILYIIGVTNDDIAKKYLNKINNYAKIIISVILMWKFNIFRKKEYFTEIDKSVVFHSGLFLFLTTSMKYYVDTYLTIIKTYIESFFPPKKTQN